MAWMGKLWFGMGALLFVACSGRADSAAKTATPLSVPPRTANSAPQRATAGSATAAAAASPCVDRAPDPPEVLAWQAEQSQAVAANLSVAAGCFTHAPQPVFLQVELERRTATSSQVWIIGSSTNDCTITECVTGKLSGTPLPEPPATLPSNAKRTAQVILAFDARETPALRLSATPNVALLDGPCVDQSHLPSSGRLSAAHIRGQVRAAAPLLRECYEQGLARDANLTGRVEFRFKVALDGSVEDVELKTNSVPDCQVVGCMSDVFRGLHFDKPQGGTVTVVYPFQLSPF